MKRGGGKQKGSANERELAKLLSKWWTGKDTPIVFWRVGSSGAQFTLSGGTTEMAGDVVAIHLDGADLIERFSFETKFVKHFDLVDLLFPEKKTNQLEEWWEQCTRDAGKVNRHPLLVFKRNRLEYLFMMEEETFRRFKTYDFPIIIHNKRVIGRFNDFLKKISKEMIVECIEIKSS